MHLWCRFYVSQPLFGETQLDGLQSVIYNALPGWSSGLHAAEDEDSKDGIAVRRDRRLFDCLHQVAPPRRGLSDAVLSGAYPHLSCFLYHSDTTLPPESNRLAIEVYNLLTVEGKTTSDWARATFEAIVARLPVRYAAAFLSEEHDEKNMIDDGTGVRAIGVNITQATPGLYWLNFFGRPYVDQFGRERLLAAPAFEVKPVDDGVLIALDSAADAWTTVAYQAREHAVIEHLGRQYFFSRHDSARKTIAPDFRAYLKSTDDS